ncbi:serine carboxypeptidase-like 50 [Andrographis paniculata]|uniref:serine carboxypeptidase-like 50 n=1 Tax=Andrographis paniculata TaxID=175694 RepID=UPI0021E835C6|nr:serine carboxypeptidase-like 50 [Andrographis paniculata]XP_051129622.1 serine carboxypeptidase-like 50 [Andrographis paniculata]XP_051129623.1 serine carboxypeptidase-like 50 [Andrographis paniculata]
MESPVILLLLLLVSAAAAAVSYPKEALPTKSGYLKVNSTSGSSIFYTFYEAQTHENPPTPTIPILIWLQGGPGCSSMLANLYELGPWLVNQDLSLQPNPAGSWNRIFGLLFLDSPIATGFSFAASPQEIPRDQDGVATHLYTAINQFLDLDVGFRSRPVYITGESYAGKYVPSIGYYILRKNAALPPGEERINLGGVAIGNGLTDPEIQVTSHAVQAYNLGLINGKQKALLEELQRQAVERVRRGEWGAATNARKRVLNELTRMTGLATLYDFRRSIPYQDELVEKFLNNPEAKKALGANESAVFELCSDVVEEAMSEDVMKSARWEMEFLVEKTKVLLYQGQCDLRDGVVSTVAWMKEMKWEGVDEFLEAERKVWRVDGKLAGYVQKWRNLSHVVVVNAGHLVPTDQPVNSQVMIQDWVLDRGLFRGDEVGEVANDFGGTVML